MTGRRKDQATKPSDKASPRGSVWFCGERDLTTQLGQGGYLPGTAADRDLIPPAIAAHAIGIYTQPGSLVLDPDCGAGTVLVEALGRGRAALGLTAGRRWWRLARANLTAAKLAGAWPDGSVWDRPSAALATVQASGIRGTAALVLTTLRRPHQPGALDHLVATLTHARTALRSGGHLVVIALPHRDPTGVLADIPTAVLAAGQKAGLVAIRHVIAVTGPARGDRVLARAGLAERRRARAHPSGKPIALTAHRHVLVFRATDSADHVLAALAAPVAVLPPAATDVAALRSHHPSVLTAA